MSALLMKVNRDVRLGGLASPQVGIIDGFEGKIGLTAGLLQGCSRPLPRASITVQYALAYLYRTAFAEEERINSLSTNTSPR